MALNDNAKKWVAALRSGEFPQGKGWLRGPDGYCCLGVGCEVYQREVGGLHVEVEYDGSSGALTTYDGHYCYMPKKVAAWFGLRVFKTSSQDILVDLNDDGVPFPDIADIIESEPEGLFVEGAGEQSVDVGE